MILAADLGGTRIKIALVGAGGSVGAIELAEAPPDAPSALARTAQVGRQLLGNRRPTAVGIAVPGLVSTAGVVLALPGKFEGIEGFDLPAWARETFGAPATVANDAVAYGVGEARFGAGQGAQRVLVVTIGTGVGVCVVDGGQPVGSGPLGGGITGGNIPLGVKDPELLDTAERPGTVEAYCRARRIVDFAAAVGCTASTVPEVYAAAAAGDDLALQGLATYRSWLVLGLSVLTVAHGAELVVLGGGPVVPRAPILDGLTEGIRANLWPGHHLELRRAELGDGSALAGIAALTAAGS